MCYVRRNCCAGKPRGGTGLLEPEPVAALPGAEVDSPDQRLTSDLDLATSTAASVVQVGVRVCVCMRVWMCVGAGMIVCACVDMCGYVCRCRYNCVEMCICTCMLQACVCVPRWAHVCAHACARAHVCVRVRVRACVCACVAALTGDSCLDKPDHIHGIFRADT